ncbi:MAG: hypothetical protein IT238_06605 [Bacteroidia bacterium]|nr:hypothetical protein [Bacteroidia bacterium]MCZ2249796.1 hypothetical protein [Bacteroidia bacterium]
MSIGQSFSDFKQDFYYKVKDFKVFNCAEFNALKIVLDGIRVDYVSRGPVKSPIIGSYLKFELINKIKRVLLKIKKTQVYSTSYLGSFSKYKYLISDDGRIALDAQGTPHSYYFDTLINSLGHNQCLHISDKIRNNKAKYHIHYETLINTLLYLPSNEHEKILIREINITYNNIVKSNYFNQKDLENIAFAFQNFFNKYKVWSRFLSFVNPQTAFCIVHYHNEGKILALKRKGINVTELQHGLISTKDVFYVFPPMTSSIINIALFADEIWVYGQYWKTVLEKGVEYVNKIKVAGYYLYDSFEGYNQILDEIDNFAEGNKIILVTTQTTLHQPFNDYIIWLANDIAQKKLPYKIIVKNHPLEKAEHYQILNDLKNVKIYNYPLLVLFKKSQIHVSIYSTTLFDGVRAGVPGFALYNEQYKDYIEEIIQSGVATLLQIKENPIEKLGNIKTAHPDYYYSNFDIGNLI